MNLLVSALIMGLIQGLLALGVFITYRLLRFLDLTVDGALTLGAATAAALILAGWHPLAATLAAGVAGAAAGAVTGCLHTLFRLDGVLAGILVMIALYTVNLAVMGQSNLSLLGVATLPDPLRHFLAETWHLPQRLPLGRPPVALAAVSTLLIVLAAALAGSLLLGWFLRTDLGVALRVTGINRQMAAAGGANPDWLLVLGLGMGNAMVGLAGALMAQYQGFADITMGIGAIAVALAGLIVGESLARPAGLAGRIAMAFAGAIAFRLAVALALKWGLPPQALRLFTAVFVLIMLAGPDILRRWRSRRRALAVLPSIPGTFRAYSQPDR